MSVFTFKHLILGVSVVLMVPGCMSNADRSNESQAIANRKAPIIKLAGDINVVPSVETLDRGRVLMSYSDCFTCHKEDDKKRGPAFSDIAARYPMNSAYIQVLAQRVIQGAKGAWGNVVMLPHPNVSEEDAEMMVMYILSLGDEG